MNEDIYLLSEKDILDIHSNQIELYGGQDGIRSHDLLDSAVHHVHAEFDGQRIEIASAYIFHICQNHCFIDGNKRTALASGLVFLDINGIEFNDPDERLYDMMIGVTEGKVTKEDIQKIISELSE